MDTSVRTRLSTAMALGIIAFTAAACGSEPGDRAAPVGDAAAHEEHLDRGILTRFTLGNYVGFPTPAAVLAESENVVVGTIDGYQDGETIAVQYSDGTTELDHFVVLRVKVTDPLKAPPGVAAPMVYLSHPRGVEVIESDGTTRKGSGEGYTVSTLDEFAEAIPVGTRVLALANPWAPTGDKRETVTAAPDIPDGQTTLDIQHPQRFIVEGADNSPLSGWQDYKSFDELVAEVREATSQ